MKYKSIIILLLSFMFLMVFGSTQVLADSTSDNYNNYSYPMSTYKKPVIHPFSLGTSGQTENISPADGGLEIKQTDLSLKGKNGLDFNLTRIYRTSDALLYEPLCNFNWYFQQPYIQGYYVRGTETKEIYTNGNLTSITNNDMYFCAGNPYQVLPMMFPTYAYYPYWSTSQQAQKMADNFNAGIYDTSVTSTSGNNTILTVTKYSDKQNFNVQIRVYLIQAGIMQGQPIFVPEYYMDSTSALTATDKFFNLGTGWSFDLPYIEQRGNGGGELTANVDFYLNLGSRGTVHFPWQINFYDSMITAMLTQTTKYSIPLTDADGVGDLKLNYIINKTTPIYSNAEGNASFELIEKDGKKLYFGHNGGLMAIVDRFGNQIQFLHTTSANGYPLIRQIIDSVGRIINISYQANKVTIKVDDQTNPSNNRVIYYNKTTTPANSSKYMLTSVTDANGRSTQYTYEQKNGNFSFWKKDPYNDPSSPDGINFYECLKSIVYPTGGKTVYDYNDGKYSNKNLGIKGFLHFFKVTDRADYAKDGTKYNHKSYKYYNYFDGGGTLEFDGYPSYSGDSVPGSGYFNVKTDVTDAVNNLETYTYNYFRNIHNDLLCTNILYLGADHKRETQNSYDSSSKLLTQRVNRTYNKTTGAYIDKIENYRYDGLKNLLNYWDPQANGNTADTGT